MRGHTHDTIQLSYCHICSQLAKPSIPYLGFTGTRTYMHASYGSKCTAITVEKARVAITDGSQRSH